MTSYTPTGPFTNGSAPGISASFLNSVETFLGYAANTLITASSDGTINFAKAGAVTNGNVGGSFTVYTPVWGTALKIFTVAFGSYNSTSIPSFTFPSNISRGWFAMTDIGSSCTATFYLSGGAVSVNTITGLGGGSAGTKTTQSAIHGNSIGNVISSADSFQLSSTSGTVINGSFLYIGT